MALRVVLFFAAILLATAGSSVYLVRRIRELVPLPGARGRVLGWALFLPSTLPLARFVGPAEEWLVVASVIGFSTWLACMLATALLLVVDTLAWLGRRVERWWTRRSAETATPPAPSEPHAAAAEPMPRREMLRRVAIGASLATGAGTSAYGFALGRHDYVLEEVPVRLSRLPRALDGYTIAQLSDVHVGTFVGRPELEVARAMLRRARADLIVLTGDLVDHDPRYLPDLGVLLRAIADVGARDGVVAVLGNHDYYTGESEVAATLRAAGVRVLRNASTTIGDAGGRFALVGVDDVWAPRYGYGVGADLPRALEGVDTDLAKILLCHNPEEFARMAPHVDLQLSGHTHGGQVSPIVQPAALVLPYVAGRYREGDAQLYVNRGFGTAGPPARIGSAPEVTRITLVAG
ncbi:MAG: metallophosphoesterase [Sandaracinus sp.]